MLLYDRKFLRTVSIATSIPSLIFIVMFGSIVLYSFGIRFAEPMYAFTTGGFGIALMIVTASCAVVLISSLVWSRVLVEKRRRIRYMIASYLHYSKVGSNKRIPIEDISSVIGSDPREVLIALEVMIDRKEIRGSLNHEKDMYKHISIGKKGRNLRFLNDPMDNEMIKGTIAPDRRRR
ncbi:MAG: hypothetical protein QCI82_02255 [Candidatus Thermoplasmatota archaeon]|nr:hypothetical protein [Candidatus Thermoplasmatota archaeon]